MPPDDPHRSEARPPADERAAARTARGDGAATEEREAPATRPAHGGASPREASAPSAARSEGAAKDRDPAPTRPARGESTPEERDPGGRAARSSGGGGGGGGGGQDESKARGRLDQLVPDIVRRTFYAGLGALFTTEEGIRKIAGEFQLPKDVANFLIHQAASSKDELFRIVAKELRSFLESANLSGEVQKLLTSLSFEIKTEIRFIPNEESVGGVKPEVKREVAVRRTERRRRQRRREDRSE
jgi:hypothetical protein